MKNKSILILSIVLLANLNLCFAQLTLENVYELPPCSTKLQMFSTEEMNYYIAHTDNSVLIYNLDHSEYKTVSFQEQTILEVHLASDKLFNNDEKIEFIILIKPENEYKYIWKLANEDGDILQTLWEPECGYDQPYRQKYVNYYRTNDGLSKIIIGGPLGPCTTFVVFSATGQLTDMQLEMLGFNNSLIYPNPTNNFINLKISSKSTFSDYSIVSINGITKDRGTIDPNTNELRINVSNYSKGIYILTYDNNNYRFVVK